MPRIHGIGGAYRFYFYSFDCNERIHVHVRREGRTCKFWMEPVSLASNDGFPTRELNIIRRLTMEHKDRIVEAWHEHCGDK